MAQKVLILGESGTGKSASLRNFSADEVFVINSAGKPLPFKNHFETVTPRFEKLTVDIMNAMTSTKKKVIVIDDVQYILSFPMMRRIKESGWDKWNDIQGDFFNIIQTCDDLPADVIVYFLSHIQHTDDGREKIKTVGKMLDEKITIEGLFTVVLKTSVNDGTYCFLTQNSGMDTVKSPIGMFDTYAIDNDLKYVDTKIRNYYEIGNYVADDEMKELDQEAAKPEIEKPAADGRSRRRKERENVKDKEEKPEEASAEEKKEEAAETTDSERENRRNRRRTSVDRNTDTSGEEVSTEGRRRSAKTASEQPSKEVKEETPANDGRRRRRRKNDEWMDLPDGDTNPFGDD